MRFVVIFALTATILASALYGLILAVDPYNKFGYNLFGFETKAVDFARENKYNQVEHAKKDYNAFIMGSSSAHRYLTSVLNRLTGLVSYNYSTQSATPEDYIAMTRHILTKFKPKLILISFDYEVLAKKTKTDDMFYSSPLKQYLNEVPAEEMETELFNNAYLTLKALSDSFQVIWVNLFGKAHHAYLEDGNHVVDPKPKKLKINQFARPDEVDPKRIAYLKTIKELGQKHGFKVVAFTSPISYEHYQRIQSNPEQAARLREFKTALVEVFGEVWDFEHEGMQAYSDLKYFMDSNHPTHFFSTMVLEEMFSGRRPTFGRLLTQ